MVHINYVCSVSNFRIFKLYYYFLCFSRCTLSEKTRERERERGGGVFVNFKSILRIADDIFLFYKIVKIVFVITGTMNDMHKPNARILV